MFYGVKLVGLVLIIGIFAAGLFPAHRLDAATSRPGPQVLGAFTVQPGLPNVNDIFNDVNNHRFERGLPPLQKDVDLTQIAIGRAEDMAKRTYYAHKDPEGLFYYDILRQQGIETGYSCENLGLRFGTATPPYINDWLNSTKGHRECLLDPTVNRAGYAVSVLDTSAHSGNDIPAYIVVAIHAEIN